MARVYLVYAYDDPDEAMCLTVEDTLEQAMLWDEGCPVYSYDMEDQDGRRVAVNERFEGLSTGSRHRPKGSPRKRDRR